MHAYCVRAGCACWCCSDTNGRSHHVWGNIRDNLNPLIVRRWSWRLCRLASSCGRCAATMPGLLPSARRLPCWCMPRSKNTSSSSSKPARDGLHGWCKEQCRVSLMTSARCAKRPLTWVLPAVQPSYTMSWNYWQCAVRVQGVCISRFINRSLLLCIQMEMLCIHTVVCPPSRHCATH